MQPALEILELPGAEFGLDSPRKFFWASGWLSSVLDNAPTYLVFFEAAQAHLESRRRSQDGGRGRSRCWPAIRLGSVMMGAMTYIGNGPNFMVKTIAEKSGVRMPSFFGYLSTACCSCCRSWRSTAGCSWNKPAVVASWSTATGLGYNSKTR